MEKKFIKNLQGKDFVLFEGLLNEFHSKGGKKIETEIVSTDPFIIRATVSGKTGTFQGMGDANDQNVGALVAKHKIRMAETRAIARALRWYNNIGMCSADELGDGTGEVKEEKIESGSFGKDVNVPLVCSNCNSAISEKVRDYSIAKFGKTLCMPCQDKEK